LCGFAAIAVIALLAPVIPIRPRHNNRNSGKYSVAKEAIPNPHSASVLRRRLGIHGRQRDAKFISR
jgi:hypothetical protein